MPIENTSKYEVAVPGYIAMSQMESTVHLRKLQLVLASTVVLVFQPRRDP
jgi:hypothetical protein